MENSKSKNGKELTKTEQIGEPHREILTERTRSKTSKPECRDRPCNALLNASLRPLSLVYSFLEVFLDLVTNSPCNRLSANHIEKLVEIQMEPVKVVRFGGFANDSEHIRRGGLNLGIYRIGRDLRLRIARMFSAISNRGIRVGIDAESLIDCGEFRLEKDFPFPFFIESFREVQNGWGNGKELKNEFRVNGKSGIVEEIGLVEREPGFVVERG